MSVTKLSGLFLFYFFFLFLFFFSKVGLVLSGSIIRVSSCQICHVSTPAQISGAPWLNRSRFIISLPFSRGNSENWRDPWRRFQIKLTPPPQLTSLQSAEPVAHVGDAVAWNRASFLCVFFTEILCRMQRFTQKKRDSMQGLHSTHQLLKCWIMWEPLCAHLQRSVWLSQRVICVQNHAVCVQTVAQEVNAKTPPV